MFLRRRCSKVFHHLKPRTSKSVCLHSKRASHRRPLGFEKRALWDVKAPFKVWGSRWFRALYFCSKSFFDVEWNGFRRAPLEWRQRPLETFKRRALLMKHFFSIPIQRQFSRFENIAFPQNVDSSFPQKFCFATPIPIEIDVCKNTHFNHDEPFC